MSSRGVWDWWSRNHGTPSARCCRRCQDHHPHHQQAVGGAGSTTTHTWCRAQLGRWVTDREGGDVTETVVSGGDLGGSERDAVDESPDGVATETQFADAEGLVDLGLDDPGDQLDVGLGVLGAGVSTLELGVPGSETDGSEEQLRVDTVGESQIVGLLVGVGIHPCHESGAVECLTPVFDLAFGD